MRNIAYVIIGVVLAGALVLANPPGQQSRSAEVLLGQALHQEEVEGNLDAAIATYKKILAEYPGNRPLGAKALLQMGRCYEKLGKDGARKAYERLVRDYSDQSEAKVARSRLAALARPSATTLTARKLENPPEDAPLSAVSPDGRYLCFWDWETEDLAIRDLRTGKDRRLTNETASWAGQPAWSPDGKQVAFAWHIGSGAESAIELRVVGLDGGKPRVLSHYDTGGGEDVGVLGWSPDGKQILALVSRGDGPHQMVLVSTEGGSTRVLTEMNGMIYPVTAHFSPDGRYIAYDLLPDPASPDRDIYLAGC